jgi:hypothetical protein
VSALPRGAAYLPAIDPEFEFVTDDLIGRVESWLDIPWTTAIPPEAREAFLGKYSVDTERACKQRRRVRGRRRVSERRGK